MLGQERRVHLGPCTKAQMNTPFLGHVRPMLEFHVGHRHGHFEATWGFMEVVGGLKNSQQKKLFVGIFLGSYLEDTLGHFGLCGGHVGAMCDPCWADVGPGGRRRGHVGPMLDLHWAKLGLCWSMLGSWGPCWGHLERMLRAKNGVFSWALALGPR